MVVGYTTLMQMQREGINMAKKIKYKVVGGCVTCMTCLYQCPKRAISLIEDVSAVIDPEKCIGCGRCFSVCQPGAIEAFEVEE